MEYQYIRMEDLGTSKSGKTNVFGIVNKASGDALGVVHWHGPWRQYVFAPCDECLFSTGCLEDIIDFIRMKMKEHRDQKILEKNQER